jgi:nitroimidazol reductase NimA-like FMN-containing flavoprotein (pyridoxamine 5'-phosphate oxidase superfamily)
VDIDISGPWQRRQIDQYLAQTRLPIRLACVAEDGFPRVVSVWFRYAEGVFFCATHRDSQLARMVQRNPRVGFEVSTNEPPYFGVRGQGLAELSTEGGEETLRTLIDRYLGASNASLGRWLMSRGDEELLLRVETQRFYSWDYRKRMESVA